MDYKLAKIASKLNGWRRLWLVVSIIALAATFFYISTFIPTGAKLRNEARLLTQSLHNDHDRELKEISDHCHSVAKDDILKLFECFKLNNQFKENLHHQFKELSQQIFEQTEKQIEETLLYNQVQFIFKTLGLWAIFSSALYVLGVLVAWIIFGFRHNPKQPP